MRELTDDSPGNAVAKARATPSRSSEMRNSWVDLPGMQAIRSPKWCPPGMKVEVVRKAAGIADELTRGDDHYQEDDPHLRLPRCHNGASRPFDRKVMYRERCWTTTTVAGHSCAEGRVRQAVSGERLLDAHGDEPEFG